MSLRRTVSRRCVLAGFPAGLAGSLLGSSAQASGPSRIAALEWASAETLLALGIELTAIADAEGYRRWVVEPALPSGVIDVGLRTEPNLELLRRISPDLITVVPGYGADLERLSRISATASLSIYTNEYAPLAAARRETLRLAGIVNRQDACESLSRELDALLEEARERLARRRLRSVYLVNLTDRRHVAVFGQGSMFDDVLARLGVRNAWDGPTNSWGWATAVGIERLSRPDAGLVYFRPASVALETAMRSNRLWRSLPFARAGLVRRIEPVWYFGGLASAARFARLVTQALVHAEAG